MKRLTFEGDFCDIALCREVRGGSYCEDGCCSQRRVWERLKAYEDTGMEPEKIVAMRKELDAALDCINQIQTARDHTRPAYVVDEILAKREEKGNFDA